MDILAILTVVFSILFSGIVAASTVFYVLLTRRLVSETRQLRRVQTEPRVTVRIQPVQIGIPGFDLVIQNEGQGPAKNVRLEFEGDSSYFRNSWIGKKPPAVDQLPAIKQGLDYMATGYALIYQLGTVSPEEFERASLGPWRFNVSYENLAGEKSSNTCVLDFSHFRGTMLTKDWLKEITGHLYTIRHDLSKLTNGRGKVQVVTQTLDHFEKRPRGETEGIRHTRDNSTGYMIRHRRLLLTR